MGNGPQGVRYAMKRSDPMKRCNLTLAFAALILVGLSETALAGGQTKTYQVVPVSAEYSGGGQVTITISGPWYKGDPTYKYWHETRDGTLVFPQFGSYYIYFDSVPMYSFESSLGNAVLYLEDFWDPRPKPSFPRVIYVFDGYGNLVMRSK
jgi:hypothetical protein